MLSKKKLFSLLLFLFMLPIYAQQEEASIPLKKILEEKFKGYVYVY